MQSFLVATIVLAAAALSGCASVRTVDTSVLAIAAAPSDYAWRGATYDFERLPSLALRPETQMAELHAERALTEIGLRKFSAQAGAPGPSAQLSVLVGFQGFRYLPTGSWGQPLFGEFELYGGIGRGVPWGSGWGLGMGVNLPPPPRYRREVSLIFRDLKTGRIVYESRAVYDGPFSESAEVFSALFKAALTDFPTPPQGSRQVIVNLGR
jgi:uncharacterized protein YceK